MLASRFKVEFGLNVLFTLNRDVTSVEQSAVAQLNSIFYIFRQIFIHSRITVDPE